jgi:hypothetical protein
MLVVPGHVESGQALHPWVIWASLAGWLPVPSEQTEPCVAPCHTHQAKHIPVLVTSSQEVPVSGQVCHPTVMVQSYKHRLQPLTQWDLPAMLPDSSGP